MDQEQQQQQEQEKPAVVAAITTTLKQQQQQQHHPGEANLDDDNKNGEANLDDDNKNDASQTEAEASSSSSLSPAAACAACAWEERVQLVREHYERKGYRVRSGLQFGCELVLYADDLGSVHSDFCIHVVPQDGYLDWRQMQSLVRSMPALRKTLILANLVAVTPKEEKGDHTCKNRENEEEDQDHDANKETIRYRVQELALASEHAPFRLRNRTNAALPPRVGAQKKRKKDAK